MTLLDINRGTHGAKRASFQKISYRDIALKILLANPDAEPEDVVEEFVAALLKNRGALTSLAIYGLANVRASIIKPPARRGSVSTLPVSIREQIAESTTAKLAVRVHQKLLMDFVMPNGKTLGQSSGAEVAKAMAEYGVKNRWMLAITKKVGPREIVGDKLTEADLKKMEREAKR